MENRWECPECGKDVPEKPKRGPHLSGCRRRLTAKYVYDDSKDPAHKHPLTQKVCACGKQFYGRVSQKGWCSVSCAQSAQNNSMWKGKDAGYVSKHARVYRARGAASSCAWGCIASRYEWANLTGDYDDVYDYAQMCTGCHQRYDGAVAKCFDKLCKRGHTLNNSTMYVKIRNGKEVRQCRLCALERAAACSGTSCRAARGEIMTVGYCYCGAGGIFELERFPHEGCQGSIKVSIDEFMKNLVAEFDNL